MDGPCAIEEIRIGDRVWAYDPARRAKVQSTVRFIRHGRADETPLFVNDGWQRADKVDPDDNLLTVDLRQVPAGTPGRVHGAIDVYDLTVDEPHCFFAGGYLVHNKKRSYSPGLDDPFYVLWPELLTWQR